MSYEMMKVLQRLAELQKITLVSVADFARFYNGVRSVGGVI